MTSRGWEGAQRGTDGLRGSGQAQPALAARIIARASAARWVRDGPRRRRRVLELRAPPAAVAALCQGGGAGRENQRASAHVHSPHTRREDKNLLRFSRARDPRVPRARRLVHRGRLYITRLRRRALARGVAGRLALDSLHGSLHQVRRRRIAREVERPERPQVPALDRPHERRHARLSDLVVVHVQLLEPATGGAESIHQRGEPGAANPVVV
mmetsp:Transcript_43624/g.144421  ORF Transcript_43624/g.144421 Transcript_43624/m.144421 type:complete len:212 (+) Transcript_43624:987-1622(+)